MALDEQSDLSSKIATWLASDDTGASSKCIVAKLAGVGEITGSYPVDADDFGRCERLLGQIPELNADFAKMAEVNRYWFELAANWVKILTAEDRNAVIKSIIRPIEKLDPHHVDIGEGVSIRFPEKADSANDGIPLKETAEDQQVRADVFRVAGNELRQFVERYERLEQEKKDIAEQQKEVMAEAKSRGYDVKVLRKVIALRKRDKDDIAEEEAVLQMYLDALGM